MNRPAKSTLPAPIVREFREELEKALQEVDEQGRVWANAQWGVYAFYDYDGEPIYVGQTNEKLRTRVRRHLTNQRTDAVAMRILDVFEVAEMELWPLWELQGVTQKGVGAAGWDDAKARLDAVEYSAYLKAIETSKYKAILNEKIPPLSTPTPLPYSRRFDLLGERIRVERGHPDVRIARRAETVARLTAVAHERGEVSDGLRRVIVVQAVRLAHLAATRLAYVEGRPVPPPSAVDVQTLVGRVDVESSDPAGPTDTDQMMLEED